jgi:hypothetical protein
MTSLDFASMLKAARRQGAASAASDEASPGLKFITPDFRSRSQELALASGGRATYTRDVLVPDSALLPVILSAPGWTTLKNRSLLNLGGTPNPAGMLPDPMPSWLLDVVAGLGVRANQALVNHYHKGRGSISPHKDGPNYEPRASILSVSGHCV